MKKKLIQFFVFEEEAKAIDKQAKIENFRSRSEFLRKIALDRASFRAGVVRIPAQEKK